MASITINGVTLDPESPRAVALAGAVLAQADTSDTDYILVQSNAPLDDEQKEKLKYAGAEIMEYVPESTYICHYPPVDLTPVRNLPFVSLAIRYDKGFKIAPTLQAASPEVRIADLMQIPLDRSKMRDAVDVDVVLHRNVSAADVKEKIAAAAGIDAADIKPYGRKFRVRVPRRRLDKIASIDEVRHVEEYVAPSLMNTVAIGILRADKVQASPLALQGSGQVVAVCDTGFDKGSTSDVHPAFSGRVAKLYSLGRAKANDPDGHGTHVAGSILGDATSAAADVGNVRGSAPRAKLVLQSVLDPSGRLGGIPNDLHDLFGPPYANDSARVHSNSWGFVGSSMFGLYNSAAEEVDDFVWNQRDLVICFAAGNDGTDANSDGFVDAGSVTPPGTAKNCITVGASESKRPFTLTYGSGWPKDFPHAPLKNDKVANDPEGMAAFSSRGPTRDQRIKPDVVAPGTFILSARSRDTSGSGWQATTDPLYMYDGGTSMATPLVSGSAALVREFLQKKASIASPSAALVKALLINGARDMAGQYVPSEAGPTPNVNEGFGRVDVAASMGAADTKKLSFFDEGPALTTGQSNSHTIAVAAGSTVKVTLVWTDPPGEHLQNDLDLIVRANGQERHGNMPVGSVDFDRRNNVEQVLFQNVPAGNVEVIVTAFRTVLHAQPYALVTREI